MELPGLGHSSPIVWGDRIFLTTAVRVGGDQDLRVGLYGDIDPVDDEGSFRWQLVAVDRASGKIVWEKTLHEGAPRIRRHTKSSHANSTPATNGEHVVAFFGAEGLYCYDVEGEFIWKKDLGVLDSGYFRVPAAQWGFGSSPVIHDGKVVVQCDVQKDSFVAVFDLKDGSEIWRTPRDDVPGWATPAIHGEGDAAQVILNGYRHSGGYDLATGDEIWRIRGGGDIPVPTPVVAGDLVFLTSAHGRSRPIYAVKLSAKGGVTPGSPDAPGDHLAWYRERAGNYMQTPIVYRGLAYFCYDNGVLACYSARTGERHYKHRLGGGGRGFTASPVAGDGKIYFTSEPGDVFVLRAGTELHIEATNSLGDIAMATPAVASGVLYFRTRSGLIAVGRASP